MKLIATKGRARQKTMTLAKKAGAEVKAVVFTRPELLKAIGYDPGKKYGTKRDTCLGRCFQDSKVIWLSLPVSVSTIAHEIMHLVTTTSHCTQSFENRALALSRGYAPAQHKPKWFEVIVTVKYKVFELTANDAKKHYYGKDRIGEPTITARSIKS